MNDFCNMHETLTKHVEETHEMVTKIHTALCGDIEKPEDVGIKSRQISLEKKMKIALRIVWGIGSLLGAALLTFLIEILTHQIEITQIH